MDRNVHGEVSVEDSEVDLNFDLDLVDLNEEPQCLPSPLPPSKPVLMQDFEDNDSVFSVPSSQADLDVGNPRKSMEQDAHCHTHSTISQDSGIMSSDSWLISDASSSFEGSRPHTSTGSPASECFRDSPRDDDSAEESRDVPQLPLRLTESGIPQPIISEGEPSKHEDHGREAAAPAHLPLIPVTSLTGVELELDENQVDAETESASPVHQPLGPVASLTGVDFEIDAEIVNAEKKSSVSSVQSPLLDMPMEIDDSQEQSDIESESSEDSDPGAFMKDLRSENLNESGARDGFTRNLDSIDFSLDVSEDLDQFGENEDDPQLATPYEDITLPTKITPSSSPNEVLASRGFDILEKSTGDPELLKPQSLGFFSAASDNVHLPDAETGESDDGIDNIQIETTSTGQMDWWRGDENDNIRDDIDDDHIGSDNEIITTDDLEGLDFNFSIDNSIKHVHPEADPSNAEPSDQQSETNTTSIFSSEATSPEDIPDERRPSLDPFIALSCLDEAIRTAEGDIGSLSSPETDYMYGSGIQGASSAVQPKQASDDGFGWLGSSQPTVSIIVTSPDEECGRASPPLIPYDIQPIPQENIVQGDQNVSSLADSDEDSDDFDFNFVIPTSIPRLAKNDDTPKEPAKKECLPGLADVGLNISMTSSDSESSDDDFDFEVGESAASPRPAAAAVQVKADVSETVTSNGPVPAPVQESAQEEDKQQNCANVIPEPAVTSSPHPIDDSPAVLPVDIDSDHEALESAENEWDNVRTITPGFQTEADAKVMKSGLRAHPMISLTEVIEHCQAANLSTYKDQIRPNIHRQGFSALKHALFGPPKMHRELLDQRNHTFSLAAWPLDNENVTHMRTLQTIYRRLTGSKFDCTRFGPHWEVIGFQGNDPATDLRGTGFLGLLQLLHLLTDPSLYGLAKDIYCLSLHETQNFPFSVMSINITRIVIQMLREDVLNKECNKRKEIISVINEYYAALYYHLYTVWKTQHKTIKDSGFVIRDLEAHARKNCRNVVKNLTVHLVSRREANNTRQIGQLSERDSLHLKCVNINDFEAED